MKPISYKRHRFPADVIRQAVWLYFRFTLSFRDVEELLAQRGIEVSYETIRCWTLKFGQLYGQNLRRSRSRPRSSSLASSSGDSACSNWRSACWCGHRRRSKACAPRAALRGLDACAWKLACIQGSVCQVLHASAITAGAPALSPS